MVNLYIKRSLLDMNKPINTVVKVEVIYCVKRFSKGSLTAKLFKKNIAFHSCDSQVTLLF